MMIKPPEPHRPRIMTGREPVRMIIVAPMPIGSVPRGPAALRPPQGPGHVMPHAIPPRMPGAR